MHKDEIIAEVWRNRDAYAEKHHHNLAEIVTSKCAKRRGNTTWSIEETEQKLPTDLVPRRPKPSFLLKEGHNGTRS